MSDPRVTSGENSLDESRAGRRRALKKYRQSVKGRAVTKRYLNSEKGKATKKRANRKYRSSANGKIAIRRYVKEYRNSANGKSVRIREQQRYIKKYPEKIKAHKAVARAIKRGKLVRQPCVICGSPHTEKHHPDYSKPLEAVDMCHRDHMAEHLKAKLA